MPPMLLILDPSTAATDLTAGRLACTKNSCGGVLGPWGYARTRHLRLGAGATQPHTPRRARAPTGRRPRRLTGHDRARLAAPSEQ